jgi:hypothetical protein
LYNYEEIGILDCDCLLHGSKKSSLTQNLSQILKGKYNHGRPVNINPELEVLAGVGVDDGSANFSFETEEEQRDWKLTEWQDWCIRVVRNPHIKFILKNIACKVIDKDKDDQLIKRASSALYAYLSAIDSIFSKDVDKYRFLLNSDKSAPSFITTRIQTIIGRVIASKGNLSHDELTTIALSFYEILITLEFSFAHLNPNGNAPVNDNDLNENEISYGELWTKFDFPPFGPPFNETINFENYKDVIDAGNIKKTKKVEKNHLMYTIFNHFLTNNLTCSSYFVVTLEDRIRVFLPMNSKVESTAIENFLQPYILKSSM